MLVVVLLLVGALVGCSTQRIESPGAGQAPQKELYVGLHTADWEIRVRIDPLLPGERSVALTLIPHSGEIPSGAQLALEVSQPAEATVPERFEATMLATGAYEVKGLQLQPGSGRLRVYVTTPGNEPQRASFSFTVPEK